MARKHVYLVLCILGTLVPYASFVPWVFDHGFDLSLMVEELFANRISTFFALDDAGEDPERRRLVSAGDR